jgi:hypothetical protein
MSAQASQQVEPPDASANGRSPAAREDIALLACALCQERGYPERSSEDDRWYCQTDCEH